MSNYAAQTIVDEFKKFYAIRILIQKSNEGAELNDEEKKDIRRLDQIDSYMFEQSNNQFSRLPDDIIVFICCFSFKFRDIVNFALTCKRLKTLLFVSKKLEGLFKELAQDQWDIVTQFSMHKFIIGFFGTDKRFDLVDVAEFLFGQNQPLDNWYKICNLLYYCIPLRWNAGLGFRFGLKICYHNHQPMKGWGIVVDEKRVCVGSFDLGRLLFGRIIHAGGDITMGEFAGSFDLNGKGIKIRNTRDSTQITWNGVFEADIIKSGIISTPHWSITGNFKSAKDLYSNRYTYLSGECRIQVPDEKLDIYMKFDDIPISMEQISSVTLPSERKKYAAGVCSLLQGGYRMMFPTVFIMHGNKHYCQYCILNCQLSPYNYEYIEPKISYVVRMATYRTRCFCSPCYQKSLGDNRVM